MTVIRDEGKSSLHEVIKCQNVVDRQFINEKNENEIHFTIAREWAFKKRTII